LNSETIIIFIDLLNACNFIVINAPERALVFISSVRDVVSFEIDLEEKN